MRGPLIVQSDHTLMLEVDHPAYAECRDFLARFAELVKSPEFIHTYRVTPLSLWNAAASGISAAEILEGLQRFARYDLPANVQADLHDWYSTYGKLVLSKDSETQLCLEVSDPLIFERLCHEPALQPYWVDIQEARFRIHASERGHVKQALVKIGYPVQDLCGYVPGASLPMNLLPQDKDGNTFQLRDYQWDAAEAFYHAGRESGGSGVVVLPCGSGKTVIGLGVMSQTATHTLIITTNNVAVHQWRDELLHKTTLKEEQIGEFTGMGKTIKPVTITTYQMLTHRSSRGEAFHNLDLFTAHDWGLIVYDEVHLLPAPVFRATAAIQARRRLGLTATLIREDNKQDEVFALIGPKRYDVPWKILESRGYIAEAYCTEYRVPLNKVEALAYAHAEKRERYRIAAENSRKLELARELIRLHSEDHILVIGQYLDQLEVIAQSLNAPLITGKTRQEERERLYTAFKQGEIGLLVVSKVANFAVDLPDANVMIQVSGTFGSRQEEAQRLGRILRPKKKRSHFYTLVSKGTDEQLFGINRQLFLVEQGYKYHIRYFE